MFLDHETTDKTNVQPTTPLRNEENNLQWLNAEKQTLTTIVNDFKQIMYHLASGNNIHSLQQDQMNAAHNTGNDVNTAFHVALQGCRSSFIF
jgi:hypothetical protein